MLTTAQSSHNCGPGRHTPRSVVSEDRIEHPDRRPPDQGIPPGAPGPQLDPVAARRSMTGHSVGIVNAPEDRPLPSGGFS